jgi:hypothetical protein
MARAQFVEQDQQRGDLWLGEGLLAGVVEFDADRCRVEVGAAAPPGRAGMPGAGGLVDQLEHRTVAADQVMGADAALRVGQRRQRLCRRCRCWSGAG